MILNGIEKHDIVSLKKPLVKLRLFQYENV